MGNLVINQSATPSTITFGFAPRIIGSTDNPVYNGSGNTKSRNFGPLELQPKSSIEPSELTSKSSATITVYPGPYPFAATAEGWVTNDITYKDSTTTATYQIRFKTTSRDGNVFIDPASVVIIPKSLAFSYEGKIYPVSTISIGKYEYSLNYHLEVSGTVYPSETISKP